MTQFRNRLGEKMYVEENLQARDLRTRLDRKQSVCRSWYWPTDLCRNLQARFYIQRDNENIGQVARGHQEKQMVANGGKDTLYVVSTYWIRCILGGYLPWPLGV